MSVQALLQMADVRLVSLVVEYNDEVLGADRPWQDSYDLAADVDWFVSKADDRWLVSLSLKLKPKPGVVHRFERVVVAVQGQFTVAPGTPEDQAGQLLLYNAPAMLHGVARGVLAQVTGLCVGGPLILPSLNYMELLKRKERQWARQAKAAERQAEGAGAGPSARRARSRKAPRSVPPAG